MFIPRRPGSRKSTVHICLKSFWKRLQFCFSICIPVISSQFIPISCLIQILCDSFTEFKHKPKRILRFGMTLFGRFPIPLESLGEIFTNPFAKLIHMPQIKLRFCVSLPGRFLKPRCCLRLIH